MPTMEQQHPAIERSTGGDRAARRLALTARGGEALAEAFERLLAVLLEHMALEEKEILPLAEKHITAKEWRSSASTAWSGTPEEGLAARVRDGDVRGRPGGRKGVLAALPCPFGLLVPVVGRRKYAAHAKRVHGTATPPRIGTA